MPVIAIAFGGWRWTHSTTAVACFGQSPRQVTSATRGRGLTERDCSLNAAASALAFVSDPCLRFDSRGRREQARSRRESSPFLPTARLWHPQDLADVIALLADESDESLQVALGNRGCAGHDPNVVTLLSRDDSLGIVRRQIGNPIVRLDRPHVLLAPDRVAVGIHHVAARIVGFQGTIECIRVEAERCGDGAIRVEPITVPGVVGALFDRVSGASSRRC